VILITQQIGIHMTSDDYQ